MPTLLGETRDRRVSVQEQDDNVIYTETINFLVRADHKDQTRDEILATPGFPVVGLTASTNGLGYCKSSEAATDPQNPIIWRCSAEFSTPEPGKEANTGSPLEFQPIASVSMSQYDYIGFVDAEGNQVVNSANQRWDTGFNVRRSIMHYDFVQYENPATITLETFHQRNGVTNASAYPRLGLDANDLLLEIQSAEIGTYHKEYCWRVKYRMSHRFQGWKLQRLDTGIEYIEDGKLVPYRDKMGNRINGNLNGAGGMTGNNGTDPPAILEFAVYPELEFDFIRL